MDKGTLFLIPANLGDDNIPSYINPAVSSIINHCRYFIVENERSARRFLIKAGIKQKIDDLQFMLLNKHTSKNIVKSYLDPLLKAEDVGLISEAGCPAVADPGAGIVQMAHQEKIKVSPLPGPSSILLALMSSGLNGQSFSFSGYLPIDKQKRKQKIKYLELLSKKEKQTQIFIETPYRNKQLFDELIKLLTDKTQLCIAANILQKDAFIQTKSIKEWKKQSPRLHKIPAVFLFLA